MPGRGLNHEGVLLMFQEVARGWSPQSFAAVRVHVCVVLERSILAVPRCLSTASFVTEGCGGLLQHDHA